MKYIILTCFLGLMSCSHTSKHEPRSYQWAKEAKDNQIKQKRVSQIFKWFENIIENHQEVLENHIHYKKLQQEKIHSPQIKSSNILVKKAMLHLNRSENEVTSEHTHYLNDQLRFEEILSQLKGLKNDLQSHNHEH